MRRDEIDNDLSQVSFEFFYHYSRFEFALKENGFLKYTQIGDSVEPSWDSFRKQAEEGYSHSHEAQELISLHPKRQIIGESNGLTWRHVGLDNCNSQLCKVITMISCVRNNLFHGGKSGDIDVDSKARNTKLLSLSIAILDQLAEENDLESDYYRIY